MLGFYWQFYCSAYWIFAMKYWVISYKLSKGERMLLVGIFDYLGLFLNFAIPVYMVVLIFMRSEYVKIAFEILVWLQVLSFLV